MINGRNSITNCRDKNKFTFKPSQNSTSINGHYKWLQITSCRRHVRASSSRVGSAFSKLKNRVLKNDFTVSFNFKTECYVTAASSQAHVPKISTPKRTINISIFIFQHYAGPIASFLEKFRSPNILSKNLNNLKYLYQLFSFTEVAEIAGRCSARLLEASKRVSCTLEQGHRPKAQRSFMQQHQKH